jgi:hypothetical protein
MKVFIFIKLVWPIEELLCSPGKVTGVTDLYRSADSV